MTPARQPALPAYHLYFFQRCIRSGLKAYLMVMVVLIIAPANVLAVTFNITGDKADYELDQTLAVGNTSGTTSRCGATSATTPGGRNVIYLFELPVIGSANQVIGATLNLNYASESGSPAFNADLWGVGFYPSDIAITNVFLISNTDTNPANVKLHENLLTPASVLGSMTSSNFSAYLQIFYATNANYTGGSYVFLRVNPDASPGSVIVGYNLSTADSTNFPVLTVVATNSLLPLAPVNLVAVGGDGEISLNWFAVSGATDYRIQRSRFTGGPYTTIASLAETNYLDTGLMNGGGYYYVVSAINSAGGGADSEEATAIPFLPMSFAHPGLLHSQADIDRMRQMVSQGVEPWASAFVKLQDDPFSQSNYAIAWQATASYDTIGRGTGVGDNVNTDQVEDDCDAAYQLALMWCITSNSAYAQKSIRILNDWSSSLKNIIGTDAILAAGLDGPKFLNAAELLRYSNAGWPATNVAQFSAMMTNIFYPVVANFATFANGNWDGGCEKTMMDIGIFCDRPDLYSRATNYFYTGTGAGALTNYIYPNGQVQESGRDQQHAQLGIGQLAEVCQTAWNQGADLYGAGSNRLLAGFEYTAKYNLGYSVPYTPASFTGWSNGLWFSTTVSTNYRGEFRPIYEMVYNHYNNLLGEPSPFTAEVATNILSPEGPWQYADDPGFGTLTCSLQPRPVPANKIFANTMGASSGVWFGSDSEGDTNVAGISPGDYSSFNNVNLSGVRSFSVRVSSSAFSGTIELHLDSPTGTMLGSCGVPVTSGAQFWATASCNVAPAAGTHTLYLVYQSYTNAIVFSHSWFALSAALAYPQAGSNMMVLGTNSLTAVNIGGQPLGQAIYGGEDVANNSPARGFPVGTNVVVWVSTNLSGSYQAITQTVDVVPMADPPSGLNAVPGSGQADLTWNASTHASAYNVKQSTVSSGPFVQVAYLVAGTNYLATNLTNGTLYYFAVTSTNSLSESVNSPVVAVRPTSLSSPALTVQVAGGNLQFNWQADHTGWRLLMQTNSLSVGLGTNWSTVAGSTNSNLVPLPLPLPLASGAAFFRLVYP